MALIDTHQGCKVGWYTFDTEAEALACSEREKVECRRREAQGFDHGYCVPGEIRHVESHPKHDGREVWIVTTT